jgi:catechol 2,3-dioxygenase-like lactoylglutathione lyase family enzyme
VRAQLSKEVAINQMIVVERVDHIGIRVRDLDRALNFYRALGFSLLHRAEDDDVAIIRNENSVELNLIFNANAGNPAANVLMDAPEKYRATPTWPSGSRPSRRRSPP